MHFRLLIVLRRGLSALPSAHVERSNARISAEIWCRDAGAAAIGGRNPFNVFGAQFGLSI